MSRVAVLLGVIVAATFLSSGAAHAQERGLRNPFDPLLGTEEGTTTSDTDTGDTTGTTDTTDTTTTDTDTGTAADDDLPTTGADPRSWLALAYVLLAAGAGILAYVRVNRSEQNAR